MDGLTSLRDELLENTKSILELVRERRRIAREIAAEKIRAGTPVRDRQREMAVIDEAGVSNADDYRFLSILFEYTIMQEGCDGLIGSHSMEPKGDFITVSGDPDALSFVAGTLFSYPGAEFVCEISNRSLIDGIAFRGGHVVTTGEVTEASVFSITSGGEPVLQISSEGKMNIDTSKLNRKKPLGAFKVVRA